MQPTGNPLTNVGTPTGTAAATSIFPIFQQIVTQQKAQTDLLQKILAQSTAQTAVAAVGLAANRMAGGGNLIKSVTDKTVEVMRDIRGVLTRAAFTGPQSQTYMKSVELLLMSFGVFLAPAVMLVAAGMLTLADVINRKLLKNLDGMADGMAKAGKWGIDAAKAVDALTEEMTAAEKAQARARNDRERGIVQRYVENATVPGAIDAALKRKFGGPTDRLMRDSPEEAANEVARRKAQQNQIVRPPETDAQRAARFKWQAEHPGEMFPGPAAAAAQVAGQAAAGKVAAGQQVAAGGGPMGEFAKNFRQIMQDMRQSYVRAPVMTGIGDLWREMQLRVYQSPLEQRKLILQEQMFGIAGEVLKKLEAMVPKEN